MKSPAVIVRKLDDDRSEVPDASLLEEAQRIEASLLPSSGHLLMEFPVKGLETRYLGHLEQRIHRNPRDLTAHVRRILLWRAMRDSEGVYGAIVDLFLVLAYRGRPLRSRLLTYVRDALTAEQAQMLHDSLEDGLDPADVRISTARSCLSKHVTGTTGVVTGPQNATARGPDLLSIARDALSSGDDDTARSMLEGAVEADPGNEEACVELLSLYRRRNLGAAFRRTYTMALGRQLARPDLWRATAARFEKERQHSDEQL